MKNHKKGTTKVEIINEILDLKPSFNKNLGQLFELTLNELLIMRKEFENAKNNKKII